jgi:SAM-dependent methyltransferase
LVAPGYTDINLPQFELYAADAISLAGLEPHDRVVDVATGPGTLALLAAPKVARVDALDFSAQMLDAFRVRLARNPVPNVQVVEGDGQALPYADASFDAAFSMFGLIFFPDRARGFAELRRVLTATGRAVISSWQPIAQVPLLITVMDVLRAELPNVPFGDGKGPLSDADDLRAEMSAAGFDVTVHQFTHEVVAPDFEQFWAGFQRSFAPLVLLKHKLGDEAFSPIAAAIKERLATHIGAAPVQLRMPAWLALGRCR